jgi:hypothetical protein
MLKKWRKIISQRTFLVLVYKEKRKLEHLEKDFPKEILMGTGLINLN